jgi:hypothetical protein
MNVTRGKRLGLCVSVGAMAALVLPQLAVAETPVPAVPVQPCLASSNLPVANPLPCPAAPGAQPSGGQTGGAGAGGSAGTTGAAGAGGAANTNTQVTVTAKKRTSKPRRHRAARHRRRTRHRVSRRHR